MASASNTQYQGTFGLGISGSTIVGNYLGVGSPPAGDGFIAVPTPEPASLIVWSLLGMTGIGVFALRKRYRRA